MTTYDSAPLAYLLAETGNDHELVADFVATYVTSATRLLAEIDAAMRAGDTAKLGRAGHTLASTSATVGAMAVAVAARDVEEHADRGSLPAAGAIDRIGVLVEEVSELLALEMQGWRDAQSSSR